VMFLGYWNRESATRDRFTGDWMRTGDMARLDTDGHFWFEGRNDDLINSSGYRIGPTEIEGCLMSHPAVAMAAVVGVPDPIRGQIVKAFLVLRPGWERDSALRADIQNHVRTRLAAYEYPREIEFVRDLPLTTTGKIRRAQLRALTPIERAGG
jgi:acetyl-CoA synthetase